MSACPRISNCLISLGDVRSFTLQNQGDAVGDIVLAEKPTVGIQVAASAALSLSVGAADCHSSAS